MGCSCKKAKKAKECIGSACTIGAVSWWNPQPKAEEMTEKPQTNITANINALSEGKI